MLQGGGQFIALKLGKDAPNVMGGGTVRRPPSPPIVDEHYFFLQAGSRERLTTKYSSSINIMEPCKG